MTAAAQSARLLFLFRNTPFHFRQSIVKWKKRNDGAGETVEQELEIIQGVIGAVVFENYDNGYAVLRLLL